MLSGIFEFDHCLKMVCFQLPAVISKGITIVISPLLSLIQDQIQNLLNKGVVALTISSSQSDVERNFSFTGISIEIRSFS